MNIPNIISMFRFMLIPFFAFFFLSTMEEGRLIAGVIFALACISDIIDGYIARKYHMITKLGEALDPLADKLMQMTVVLCVWFKNVIGVWIVFAFILKEVLMIVGGTVMMTKFKHVIPSKWYGKAATVLVSLAVFIAIVFKDLPPHFIDIMFGGALGMSLFAFIRYYIIYKREK
jgi:cardiolipin synthase